MSLQFESGPSTVFDDAPDDVAEMAGLDFVAAIRAHQAWKGRLMAYLKGELSEPLDAQQVERDDACVLGRWLCGAGCQALVHQPLLPEVRASHARFHQLAAEVVRAVQAENHDAARQLLLTDYQRASVRVQGRLAELFLSASPAGRS